MNRSRLRIVLLAALTVALSGVLTAHAQSDDSSSTGAAAAPVASTENPQNVVVTGSSTSSSAATNQSWYGAAWNTAGQHLSDIWNKGDYSVMIPFWTYHMPYAYSAEKRAQYTEYPAGGGISKGYFNDSGNWEGIYLMEYQDSHGKPMYMGGYGWVPTWRPIDDKFKIGAGLTAFMFMRSDIGNYAPIPGVLPVGSIGYGPVDVQVAYVPGGQGNGNVLFWWARFTFQ